MCPDRILDMDSSHMVVDRLLVDIVAIEAGMKDFGCVVGFYYLADWFVAF